MKNEIIKVAITTIAIIIATSIIMLIPQLIHTGFHLVAVDWQTVVASSILIDECVFLGAVYANMKKTEAK